MSKFQVGDRVAFYNNGYRYVTVIKRIGGMGEIFVEGEHGFYHFKQFRKLKPKAKPIEFECDWNLHPLSGLMTPCGGPTILHAPDGVLSRLRGKRTKVRVTILK